MDICVAGGSCDGAKYKAVSGVVCTTAGAKQRQAGMTSAAPELPVAQVDEGTNKVVFPHNPNRPNIDRTPRVLIVADWDNCTVCHAFFEVCQRIGCVLVAVKGFLQDMVSQLSGIDAVVLDARAFNVPERFEDQKTAWLAFANAALVAQQVDVPVVMISTDSTGPATLRQLGVNVPHVYTSSQALEFVKLC